MADLSANPLLALVRERGLIDDLQLEEVSQEIVRSGKPTIQVIQDYGLLDLDSILQIIADHLGTSVVPVTESEITPEVLVSSFSRARSLLRTESARLHRLAKN